MAPIMRAHIPQAAQAELTKPLRMVTKVTWGRRQKALWADSIIATAIVLTSPVWLYVNWIALQYFKGSLVDATKELFSNGLFDYARLYFPQPSTPVFFGYGVWLSWQIVLYYYGPGRRSCGQRTPGGHLLQYTANGLFAWIATHLVYFGASLSGHLDPAIIAAHWEHLLVAVNTYMFAVAILVQCKGYWAPSYLSDRKISGSWTFDYFSGVELNPRIGQHFDLKFFSNSRPGIVAWTLINFSWAAYQYRTFGFVTNSMVVINILQALYVLDFFIHEQWYVRTVDIAHDHYGFYLAWGTNSFLPQFYTLQSQYLARYPTHLTDLQAVALLAVGIGAYSIFRASNLQKDIVRKHDGHATVWGEPARYLRCTYLTDDGTEHTSILLTCGWWGVCRHINYLADLILTLTMCATCGFNHILPWSHFFFMCILLFHRLRRDERRCRNKYGTQWDRYCATVKYRLVPGLW